MGEDADNEPQQRGRRLNHSRAPSVGDVLRGRRKENCSPSKIQRQLDRDAANSASPLGERHINSPPPPKRIPTKTGDEPLSSQRPTHKKTGSSVSLKGFIRGKEKSLGCDTVSSTEDQVA